MAKGKGGLGNSENLRDTLELIKQTTSMINDEGKSVEDVQLDNTSNVADLAAGLKALREEKSAKSEAINPSTEDVSSSEVSSSKPTNGIDESPEGIANLLKRLREATEEKEILTEVEKDIVKDASNAGNEQGYLGFRKIFVEFVMPELVSKKLYWTNEDKIDVKLFGLTLSKINTIFKPCLEGIILSLNDENLRNLANRFIALLDTMRPRCKGSGVNFDEFKSIVLELSTILNCNPAIELNDPKVRNIRTRDDSNSLIDENAEQVDSETDNLSDSADKEHEDNIDTGNSNDDESSPSRERISEVSNELRQQLVDLGLSQIQINNFVNFIMKPVEKSQANVKKNIANKKYKIYMPDKNIYNININYGEGSVHIEGDGNTLTMDSNNTSSVDNSVTDTHDTITNVTNTVTNGFVAGDNIGDVSGNVFGNGTIDTDSVDTDPSRDDETPKGDNNSDSSEDLDNNSTRTDNEDTTDTSSDSDNNDSGNDNSSNEDESESETDTGVDEEEGTNENGTGSGDSSDGESEDESDDKKIVDPNVVGGDDTQPPIIDPEEIKMPDETPSEEDSKDDKESGSETGDSEKKEDNSSDKDKDEKDEEKKKPNLKAKYLREVSELTRMISEKKKPWYKRLFGWVAAHPVKTILSTVGIGIGVGAIASGVVVAASGGLSALIASGTGITFNSILSTFGPILGSGVVAGALGGVALDIAAVPVQIFARKSKLYTRFLEKRKQCEKIERKETHYMTKEQAHAEKKSLARDKQKQSKGVKRVVLKASREYHKWRERKNRSKRRDEAIVYRQRATEAIEIKNKLNTAENKSGKTLAMSGYAQKKRNLQNAYINGKVSEEDYKEDLSYLDEDFADMPGGESGLSETSSNYQTFDKEVLEMIEKMGASKSETMLAIEQDIKRRNSKSKVEVYEDKWIDPEEADEEARRLAAEGRTKEANLIMQYIAKQISEREAYKAMRESQGLEDDGVPTEYVSQDQSAGDNESDKTQ